ncbi:MAG: STAS domain-containing protein [Chloroflexi bacterium]|nr:STAS domain-containing protein [Chloroflexota bacterium]
MAATLKHHPVSRNSAVVVIAGRLDVRGCELIEDTLWDIFEGYPGNNIVLDLTNVDYLSSYAVGFLVEACGTVTEMGGRMSISGPQPQVYETLYLNGADMVIPIYDSYRTALADDQILY